MAIYFWISMPIDDFFDYCKDIMQTYKVTAYIETKSTANGVTTTTYLPYCSETAVRFVQGFSQATYYNFYFTTYPFANQQDIANFSGRFYNEQIAPHTIEGRGGVETERSREQIQLRQLQKQPDKSIRGFYNALQRKLKSIPGVQRENKGMVTLYCLPTTKVVIPPNPHSNRVEGLWEEYYFSHIMRKDESYDSE